MYDANEPDNAWFRTILFTMVLAALLCLGGAIVARAEGLPNYAVAGTQTSVGLRTGCYLRGYGQGSFVDHKADMGPVTVDGLSSKDFGGGVGIGCDYIYNQLLIGLGGDYTFQNSKFTASVGPTTAMTIPMGDEWSLWARLGWVVNPFTAVYALGGYAGAQDSSMKMATPLSTFSTALGNRRGGLVGGGVEYMISSNVAMNLEYRHNMLGDGSSTILPMKLDTTEDVVRLGLSLRWQ
jgi:opacity protein-like surface antigen